MQVTTIIAGHSFDRCLSADDLRKALTRLAQIIAFDRANGQSAEKAMAHAEIAALLANDAERIDDNG